MLSTLAGSALPGDSVTSLSPGFSPQRGKAAPGLQSVVCDCDEVPPFCPPLPLPLAALAQGPRRPPLDFPAAPNEGPVPRPQLLSVPGGTFGVQRGGSRLRDRRNPGAVQV